MASGEIESAVFTVPDNGEIEYNFGSEIKETVNGIIYYR